MKPAESVWSWITPLFHLLYNTRIDISILIMCTHKVSWEISSKYILILNATASKVKQSAVGIPSTRSMETNTQLIRYQEICFPYNKGVLLLSLWCIWVGLMTVFVRSSAVLRVRIMAHREQKEAFVGMVWHRCVWELRSSSNQLARAGIWKSACTKGVH